MVGEVDLMLCQVFPFWCVYEKFTHLTAIFLLEDLVDPYNLPTAIRKAIIRRVLAMKK